MPKTFGRGLGPEQGRGFAAFSPAKVMPKPSAGVSARSTGPGNGLFSASPRATEQSEEVPW